MAEKCEKSAEIKLGSGRDWSIYKTGDRLRAAEGAPANQLLVKNQLIFKTAVVFHFNRVVH